MRVEKDLPTSWQSIFGDGFGVNKTKMNLTGTGTSMRWGMMTPRDILTRPTRGFDKDSNAPTKLIVPSVPSSSLLMMLSRRWEVANLYRSENDCAAGIPSSPISTWNCFKHSLNISCARESSWKSWSCATSQPSLWLCFLFGLHTSKW